MTNTLYEPGTCGHSGSKLDPPKPRPFQFEPSDFQSYTERVGITSGMYIYIDTVISVANAKLQEWLASAPTVYGQSGDGPPLTWYDEDDPYLNPADNTHSARLVDIQELPKEKCEHEPAPYEFGVSRPMWDTNNYCRHCGVKLTAVWKESES